jgi:hypothetical protein
VTSISDPKADLRAGYVVAIGAVIGTTTTGGVKMVEELCSDFVQLVIIVLVKIMPANKRLNCIINWGFSL